MSRHPNRSTYQSILSFLFRFWVSPLSPVSEFCLFCLLDCDWGVTVWDATLIFSDIYIQFLVRFLQTPSLKAKPAFITFLSHSTVGEIVIRCLGSYIFLAPRSWNAKLKNSLWLTVYLNCLTFANVHSVDQAVVLARPCLLSSLPLLNYFHSHWLNRVLSYHILCEPNQPQPSILLSTLRLCNSTNWDHFRDFLGPSSVWRLFEFWCPDIFIVVKTIVQRMSILFHDFPHPTNQNAPSGSTMHVVVFFVTDAACPLFPPATALHNERTDAHWSYADEKNPSSAAKRNLWSHLSLSTGHFCLLSGPSTEIPFLPVLPLHLRWLR